MHSTASKVREFAMSFAKNVAFTTAQFLHLGTRNAVDIELCRLVRRGIIKRLAFGVFMNVVDVIEIPSAFEIAKIKAERFGIRIVESEPISSNCASMSFHTNGCKSSFHSVRGRLQFKHLAPSKFDTNTTDANASVVLVDKYLEFAEKNFINAFAAGRLEQQILNMSFRLVRMVLRLVQNKEGRTVCESLF